MKWILLLIAFLVSACSSDADRREDRRLIEWGWGTPSLQEVEPFLSRAQDLPFDGMIIDVDTPAHPIGISWTVFGRHSVDPGILDELVAQYADLPWGRLTDNFLRLTVFPADVDWFEEWGIIESNFTRLADFVRRLGFVGVVLDVEQYGEARLFNYSLAARADEIDFAGYAARAHEQGQRLMHALEAGYPGLTVLFTYALAVDPTALTPDWLSVRYALLPPFVEGMVSAASADAVLIDGYESSYIYRTAEQFSKAREQIDATPLRAGFGIWIDPVCGSGGLPPEGCGFTPEAFQGTLTAALNYTDRYVWLYSQNINWYTGAGIPGEWWAVINTFRK